MFLICPFCFWDLAPEYWCNVLKNVKLVTENTFSYQFVFITKLLLSKTVFLTNNAV